MCGYLRVSVCVGVCACVRVFGARACVCLFSNVSSVFQCVGFKWQSRCSIGFVFVRVTLIVPVNERVSIIAPSVFSVSTHLGCTVCTVCV